MINKEIEIIIDDMLFHTKELLKYFKSIKRDMYDFYLNDLTSYVLCTVEDIETIKQYIYELEIKLGSSDWEG